MQHHRQPTFLGPPQLGAESVLLLPEKRLVLVKVDADFAHCHIRGVSVLSGVGGKVFVEYVERLHIVLPHFGGMQPDGGVNRTGKGAAEFHDGRYRMQVHAAQNLLIDAGGKGFFNQLPCGGLTLRRVVGVGMGVYPVHLLSFNPQR